jgi:hypothetical protein
MEFSGLAIITILPSVLATLRSIFPPSGFLVYPDGGKMLRSVAKTLGRMVIIAKPENFMLLFVFFKKKCASKWRIRQRELKQTL